MSLRIVLLAAALSALATAGCSSNAGSGGTTGDVGGGGDGWDGRTNVEAIFEGSCSQCHGSQWSSCWQVQACAAMVDSEVSSGAMPADGSLGSSDRTTLTSWLSAGAPCAGEKPADVQGCGGFGGTPVAAGAGASTETSTPATSSTAR